MPPLFNRSLLKNRRRELRKNQTDAESLLWYRLRSKRLNHLRFVRQFSIGPYILDFYCPDQRLGIELDGGGHASEEGQKYDEVRGDYLLSKKVKVLRFWNHDVLKNLDGVLERIVAECNPLP